MKLRGGSELNLLSVFVKRSVGPRDRLAVDPHIPLLVRALLRLWNDAEWQRAEREREEREMLEYARRLLEWDGRAEELPRDG